MPKITVFIMGRPSNDHAIYEMLVDQLKIDIEKNIPSIVMQTSTGTNEDIKKIINHPQKFLKYCELCQKIVEKITPFMLEEFLQMYSLMLLGGQSRNPQAICASLYLRFPEITGIEAIIGKNLSLQEKILLLITADNYMAYKSQIKLTAALATQKSSLIKFKEKETKDAKERMQLIESQVYEKIFSLMETGGKLYILCPAEWSTILEAYCGHSQEKEFLPGNVQIEFCSFCPIQPQSFFYDNKFFPNLRPHENKPDVVGKTIVAAHQILLKEHEDRIGTFRQYHAFFKIEQDPKTHCYLGLSELLNSPHPKADLDEASGHSPRSSQSFKSFFSALFSSNEPASQTEIKETAEAVGAALPFEDSISDEDLYQDPRASSEEKKTRADSLAPEGESLSQRMQAAELALRSAGAPSAITNVVTPSQSERSYSDFLLVGFISALATAVEGPWVGLAVIGSVVASKMAVKLLSSKP